MRINSYMATIFLIFVISMNTGCAAFVSDWRRPVWGEWMGQVESVHIRNLNTGEITPLLSVRIVSSLEDIPLDMNSERLWITNENKCIYTLRELGLEEGSIVNVKGYWFVAGKLGVHNGLEAEYEKIWFKDHMPGSFINAKKKNIQLVESKNTEDVEQARNGVPRTFQKP